MMFWGQEMMTNLATQGSAQGGKVTSQGNTCIKFPNNPFPLCMIKILEEGRGDDTLCPPLKTTFAITHLMFLERFVNPLLTPPPHFKHLSLSPPFRSTTLQPLPSPPYIKVLIVHFFTALDSKNANSFNLTPHSLHLSAILSRESTCDWQMWVTLSVPIICSNCE